MYVATIRKKGLLWNAEVHEKIWSEEMMTNEIKLIASKKSFFKFVVKKTIKNEIIKRFIHNHELEIING